MKVFDDSVKDEVLKALTRCDMEIEVQMEGKMEQEGVLVVSLAETFKKLL